MGDCTSATKKISNILSDQSDNKTLESESSNEEEYHQLTAMLLNISAKVLQSDITSSTSLANRDFSTFYIVIIFLLCCCSNPTMSFSAFNCYNKRQFNVQQLTSLTKINFCK